MSLIRTVDTIIEEAIERGEFDNLPGAGKPLDLSAYFETPEDLRLAYSILRNAEILPIEAELLKEITSLRNKAASSDDETIRKRLAKEIDKRLLEYRTRMESRRRG